MKVFFDLKKVVVIAFSPFVSKTMEKQKVVEYLMSKSEEDSASSISEKMLLMAYLPFVRTIAVEKRYLSMEDLKENQIELAFESSSLAKPSNVILEVSPGLYKFLSKR